jgi:hypothetical protein
MGAPIQALLLGAAIVVDAMAIVVYAAGENACARADGALTNKKTRPTTKDKNKVMRDMIDPPLSISAWPSDSSLRYKIRRNSNGRVLPDQIVVNAEIIAPGRTLARVRDGSWVTGWPVSERRHRSGVNAIWRHPLAC